MDRARHCSLTHRGRDECRAIAIGSDSVLADVFGDGLYQPADGELGGAVDGEHGYPFDHPHESACQGWITIDVPFKPAVEDAAVLSVSSKAIHSLVYNVGTYEPTPTALLDELLRGYLKAIKHSSDIDGQKPGDLFLRHCVEYLSLKPASTI